MYIRPKQHAAMEKDLLKESMGWQDAKERQKKGAINRALTQFN